MNLLVPRGIVLKPASHDGRQDATSIEERAFNAQPRKCRETSSGEIDYRIQEFTPFHRSTRRSHAQRSSQNVDSLIRNASASRGVESRPEAKFRVEPFSEKSQDMIRSVGKRGVLRDV